MGDTQELDATTVLAWAPWVGLVAAAGVYLDDGFGTVAGMEPQTFTLSLLAVAGATWLVLRRATDSQQSARLFAGAGGVVLAVLLGYALAGASVAAVGWLALATLLAGAFAVFAWEVLSRTSLPPTSQSLSVFLVFAQALDATTTAVGIDALGYGEQSPVSAAIIEFSAGLPGSVLLGTAWLFVLVKVVLAVAIIGLLLGGTENRLRTLSLGIGAFAGLGPAVHNVVLFTGV